MKQYCPHNHINYNQWQSPKVKFNNNTHSQTSDVCKMPIHLNQQNKKQRLSQAVKEYLKVYKDNAHER